MWWYYCCSDRHGKAVVAGVAWYPRESVTTRPDCSAMSSSSSANSSSSKVQRSINAPLFAAAVLTCMLTGLLTAHKTAWLTIPGLDAVELLTFDARLRWRGPCAPADDRIVIVGFDDKFQERLNPGQLLLYSLDDVLEPVVSPFRLSPQHVAAPDRCPLA